VPSESKRRRSEVYQERLLSLGQESTFYTSRKQSSRLFQTLGAAAQQSMTCPVIEGCVVPYDFQNFMPVPDQNDRQPSAQAFGHCQPSTDALEDYD